MPLGARLHRQREVLDLRAGVVVVELARHRVALRLRAAPRARRRAPPGGRGRRAAARSDWPRRTRPGPFPDSPPSCGRSSAPSSRTCRTICSFGAGFDADVDEPGAGDLQRARRPACSTKAWRCPSTSSSAISRGLRLSCFASCSATLLAKSPCSGLRGRSRRTAISAARARFLARASGEDAFDGVLGVGHEKGANYKPPDTQSNSIGSTSRCQRTPLDVEAGRAAIQSAQEVLQRGARGRLHDQLRALVAGAARDHVRHRVVDLHALGRGHEPRRRFQESHRDGELRSPRRAAPPRRRTAGSPRFRARRAARRRSRRSRGARSAWYIGWPG